MDNLKLISVRLQPEVLKCLDDFARTHSYYTRSLVIQKVLENVINCADGRTFFQLVSMWDARKKGYRVTFSKSQDVDPDGT